MASIYKDLMNAVEMIEDISTDIEKNYDLLLIPKLRTEKLVLKYVADQVLKMENQIIILEQQVKDSRRFAFYELLRHKDSLAVKKARSILGNQDFDWRSDHKMFTDAEITSVMTILTESRGCRNDYME